MILLYKFSNNDQSIFIQLLKLFIFNIKFNNNHLTKIIININIIIFYINKEII